VRANYWSFQKLVFVARSLRPDKGLHGMIVTGPDDHTSRSRGVLRPYPCALMWSLPPRIGRAGA
jgi:hypothetical protein